MKKWTKWMAALLMACLAMTGCGTGTPKEDNNSGTGGNTPPQDVLIYAVNGDPQSFNPDMKSDDNAYAANQNIYSRLVKMNANDQIIPDLAESWEYSEDGLTLTFHLHEGVKWHDGEPFTSEDVKWTLETMKEQKWTKSDSIASVESIECPDDNTVVLNLTQRDVAIVAKLGWYATFIMPEHIWNDPAYPDIATNPAAWNPVGTGPYKFEKYEAGVGTTLVKNEDYFDAEPIIEKLIFQVIPDQSTAYQSFLNGEVDYMGMSIPVANKHELDNDPNYKHFHYLSINRTYITFNMETSIFKDVRLRQAVAMGVDRQGIYDRVANGTGALAEYFISPLWKGKYLDKQYTMPARDVEAAKKLIEEAGYTLRDDGFYFDMTMDIFESGNFKDIAQIVKENLKEIGINVTLNIMEMAAWQDKVITNSNFDMTMLAGYQGPDVSGVAGRVASNGGTNVGLYNNPEMDAALQAGVDTDDVAERAKAYSEVQRLMSEDMPMIFLFENGDCLPVSANLDGTPRDVPEKAAASEFTYANYK